MATVAAEAAIRNSRRESVFMTATIVTDGAEGAPAAGMLLGEVVAHSPSRKQYEQGFQRQTES
jgi:hypothetical protein